MCVYVVSANRDTVTEKGWFWFDFVLNSKRGKKMFAVFDFTSEKS